MPAKAIGRSRPDLVRSPWKKDWRENKILYLLFVPVLAYFIIFNYVPMSGILMAFQDFKVTKEFERSPELKQTDIIEYMI